MILHFLKRAWGWLGFVLWLQPQYAIYDEMHRTCPHDGERWAHTELCALCGAVVEPREMEQYHRLASGEQTGASNFTEYHVITL